MVTHSGDSRPFRKTNRICGVRVDANASIDAFWWMSAAINAAWARMHSHDHLLYCMTECNHPGTRERRSPQWCKLIALMDALQQPYDSVLYLDSDAFWKDPALNIRRGMLRPFAPAWFDSLLATPTMPEVVAFFGCNSPWDACGVQWNFSAAYGDRGSANSGVVLLRNQPKTRELLHQWWHCGTGSPGLTTYVRLAAAPTRPYFGACGALDLISLPQCACLPLRVTAGRRGACTLPQTRTPRRNHLSCI